MKIINRPSLLVIRPKRETCLAFYSKFKKTNVDYLTVGEQSVGKLAPNINKIVSEYTPRLSKVSNLSPVFIRDMEKYVVSCDVVILSDNYYFYNLQAIRLAQKYSKPVVTVLWATIPNHISSWLFPYSYITKKVVEASSLFILRNKSALTFAKSLKIPPKKIEMIYKGVDLNHFYPLDKPRISKKTVRILYVGKIVQSKGIFDLVEVFKRMVDEKLPVELIVAGNGPEKLRLIKTLKDYPAKILDFVGYLNLGQVYRSADIFCSPSREIRLGRLKIWEEYFSYTLMEAQASGLPIVATKSKGVCEEVDSRNNLIGVGDKVGLFEALVDYVNKPEKRIELGIINRRRAEKYFSASDQAKKTEDGILTLLNKNVKK